MKEAAFEFILQLSSHKAAAILKNIDITDSQSVCCGIQVKLITAQTNRKLSGVGEAAELVVQH